MKYKSKLCSVLITLSLLFAGWMVLFNPYNIYSQAQPENIGSDFVPGEFIVKLQSPEVTASSSQGVVKAQYCTQTLGKEAADFPFSLGQRLRNELGLEEVKPIGKQHGFRLLRKASVEIVGQPRYYLLKFSNDANMPELKEKLKDLPEFALVGENIIVKSAYIPNDSQYSLQWALPRIKAEEAWDIQTGSSSIKIAIIDAGCDMDHPDLVQNLNLSLSYDFVNDDTDPNDDTIDSHGTHVAGIIAAVGDNAKGVAGLNWKADSIIYKALDNEGLGALDKLISAIDEAIDNEVDIINMSWGTEGNSPILKDALQDASDAGIVLVAAAGNEGKLLYPAKYNMVLGVGGTGKAEGDPRWVTFTPEGKKYESAYGREIDVAAPAEDIWSAITSNGAEDYACGALSGTSMSCAFVTGLAGLILSQNPKLTKDDVYHIIKDNVDPLTTEADKPIGTGRINIFKAVKAVADGKFNRAPKAVIKADPTRGRAPLEVQFDASNSSDPDGNIVEYNWDFGDNTEKSDKIKVNHTYNRAGEFRVVLTVKDDKGATDTDTISIIVTSGSEVPSDAVWIEGKVEGDDRFIRGIEISLPICFPSPCPNGAEKMSTEAPEETAKRPLSGIKVVARARCGPFRIYPCPYVETECNNSQPLKERSLFCPEAGNCIPPPWGKDKMLAETTTDNNGQYKLVITQEVLEKNVNIGVLPVNGKYKIRVTAGDGDCEIEPVDEEYLCLVNPVRKSSTFQRGGSFTPLDNLSNGVKKNAIFPKGRGIYQPQTEDIEVELGNKYSLDFFLEGFIKLPPRPTPTPKPPGGGCGGGGNPNDGDGC